MNIIKITMRLIHNHFVYNSVSFVDGKKYNDNIKNLYRLREVSDELCKEYKLSVVLNPKKGRGIPYNEYMNEKKMKLTKNAIIKTEIDETILTAISRKDFFNQMKKNSFLCSILEMLITLELLKNKIILK